MERTKGYDSRAVVSHISRKTSEMWAPKARDQDRSKLGLPEKKLSG